MNVFLYKNNSLTQFLSIGIICCTNDREELESVINTVGGIVAKSNELIVFVLLSSLTVLFDALIRRNNVLLLILKCLSLLVSIICN